MSQAYKISMSKESKVLSRDKRKKTLRQVEFVPSMSSHNIDGISVDYSSHEERDLSFYTISNCNFRYADFEMAKLIGVQVEMTNFYKSYLGFSNLEFSEFIGVDFSSCNLFSANLSNTILENCKFKNADLRRANLLNCQVYNCQFGGAIYDDKTVLPFAHEIASQVGMKSNSCGQSV